jgi:hypothetical protein
MATDVRWQTALPLRAVSVLDLGPFSDSPFTADRGEYKNETYLLAILPHILNT